jgi:hypothetical protein
MAVDFKSIGKFEQGALIAGVVALIVSFINKYVTASYDGPSSISVSSGTNAWHSYATIGMLLIVVATVIVAVKAFAKENLPDGVPWSLLAAAAAGLGTLLVILRAVFNGVPDFPGVSAGPGWSGYILFLAGIALTVFTALSFRESGEKVPEFKKGGGTQPHAGHTTPHAGPAAPQAAPPVPPTAPPAAPPAPPAPPAAGPTTPPAPPADPPAPPAPPAG